MYRQLFEIFMARPTIHDLTPQERKLLGKLLLTSHLTLGERQALATRYGDWYEAERWARAVVVCICIGIGVVFIAIAVFQATR